MRGPVAVLALAGLLGGLVAGCTDTTRPPADDAGVELPSDLAPDLPRATATSTGPVLPDPNFERPHTALGEQLRARFPPPRQLGPGWAFPPTDERHVEVPLAVERDAEEVVDGAVPEDCSRLNPMPLPDAAAQTHYSFTAGSLATDRAAEVSVSAFAVGFDNPAVTRAFFTLLIQNRADCKDETGDDGRDLVGQVLPLEPGVVLSDRYPDDARSRRAELTVLTEHAVIMLEGPVALGERPFSSADSLRLASAFRRAIH
ncbi:MAG TPA: hypothetical protein VFM50_08960 [Nocardioidaceae bacterium]|jgi:hypothetical protein|nr:hypothetical protein [Nocardioidaceae bacterium]